MTSDAWLWVLAVAVIIALLFIMVYHLLAFDELVKDHKNPVDVCNSLNPWVLREYSLQAFLILIFLYMGEWWIVLVNLPLLGWHAKRYTNRPSMRQPGIYDPTEAFNRNEMDSNQMECCYKLGFYLLCFFFYLYKMMFALLSRDKSSARV